MTARGTLAAAVALVAGYAIGCSGIWLAWQDVIASGGWMYEYALYQMFRVASAAMGVVVVGLSRFARQGPRRDARDVACGLGFVLAGLMPLW